MSVNEWQMYLPNGDEIAEWTHNLTPVHVNM